LKHLVLASGTSVMEDERHFLKLAKWMGVQATSATITRKFPTETFLASLGGERCCLVISAAALTPAHQASPQAVRRFLEEHCATVLVFGCEDPVRHGGLLSWLTRGAVCGVSSGEPAHDRHLFELPRGSRELSRQLEGMSFRTGRTLSPPTLDPSGGGSPQTIMLANGRPMFIRVALGACEIFLLAGSDVPDIEAPLRRGLGVETYYDRLVPLLVFLRYSFGAMCWQGQASTARLIIDDPLLADRYGFLDYRALLSSMEREAYGTSIAFIPWNYRRTSVRTAKSLVGRRSNLSLCIHGCDHTSREFAGADQALLEGKAGLAIERMEHHEARTGLPFERVMVFPQGKFSRKAILALRGANYLAAVNSTCVPTDADQTSLTIAELLRPAITRFHGFPIFPRRYPRRLIDLAFDMFVGRPALLAEHHHDFREGYDNLEEFVVGLRRLEPTLTWPTLSSQLMRTCIMRSVSHELMEVQFFTRRFRLENTNENQRRFRLSKHEPDSSAVRAVLVNGINAPFSYEDKSIQVELEIDPGEARDIELVDHPRPRPIPRTRGATYHAGVLVRRVLSEFRDNTLARHPRVLRVASRLAKGLGVTGE